MNILALLQCLQTNLSKTDLRRMSRIIQAILSMSGRVTMLGISRWAGKGGSYRTVQRFFNSILSWGEMMSNFFMTHLYQAEGEYFLAGDESIVTKSGKETHGLDYFFSGLMSKVVKGISIFSLSLVSVEERRAYPMRVEQVVRTEAEKAAAKERKKKREPQKEETPKKKRGRPKGSQNRIKAVTELTPELVRIQKMLKQLLETLPDRIQIRYLALDGHFGNHNALEMAHQCGLQIISKLRYDARLYFPYSGEQKPQGRPKLYGKKIDYRHIPEQYLVERSTEDGVETRIYQAKVLHRQFAEKLNVVIITRTNLKTGAFANVILFSNDLKLSHQKIIDFYSLRFQIEFNFRDAKQHWGLEDFMNVNEVPVTNAINFSLFMVNLSQALLRDFRHDHPDSGILDLKTHFRAAKYCEEILKLLREKPEPLLMQQIFGQVSTLGSIHVPNLPASSV